MRQIRQILKTNGRHRYGRHMYFVLALTPLAYLFDASIASAADTTTSQVQMKNFPVTEIFTFLFLMLGPFKIIGPFVKITMGSDAAMIRQVAIRATLFASAALLIAAILGDSILSSYRIPLPVLALSAGIILFLVALQGILQQFTAHAPQGDGPAGSAPISIMKMAMTPLAFPTIVTPYGIAALVVFLAFSPDLQSQLSIGAVVLTIMLLNLIAMIMTQHIMPVMGLLLPILGAVLGVIQVALGLQIINNSLKAMGVL